MSMLYSLLVLVYGLLVAASGSSSCAGRCDSGVDRSKPCQCNEHCFRYSDCCNDYRAVCLDSGPGLHTCAGRCNEAVDRNAPCQCNDACDRFDDCCADYQDVCNGGDGGTGSDGGTTVITNADIMRMGDVLWNADSERFPDSEISINTQKTSHKLFNYVNEARLSSPSYALFTVLLDNYNVRTGQSEPSFTSSERVELNAYLDHLMATNVIGKLGEFLISKGKITGMDDLRRILDDIWFEFYPRSSSSSAVVDSSGFEHVFVGEKKSSSITGFHNWVQMYLLEKHGDIVYQGSNQVAEPDLLEARFLWDGLQKQRGSMFIGTSPEFEMAIYTLCFLAKPGSVCRTSIQNHDVSIQSYDVSHKAGLQIASVFPMVNSNSVVFG